MKTGILGGTFNPIHTGHLILAENAYDMIGLDQVLFVPSGVSYLKDQDEIVSASDRIRMVELAIERNPHFALSTIETDRDGNSYTYETIQVLKAKNPDDELYFLGGADILLSIHTWMKPEIIFEHAALVIAPRNDTDPVLLQERKAALEEEYRAKIVLLNTTDLEISSTDLRERIARGHSVRYYIPDPVLEYIREHQLYKRGER